MKCACGCGVEIIPQKHHSYYHVKYIQGHGRRGYKMPEEEKQKHSFANKGINLGEKNGMWKGDSKLWLPSLHDWVRRNMSKSELCPICNQKPPYDLANITGKYTRDFNNWKYLCRSCHMKFDYENGQRRKERRTNHLKQYQRL